MTFYDRISSIITFFNSKFSKIFEHTTSENKSHIIIPNDHLGRVNLSFCHIFCKSLQNKHLNIIFGKFFQPTVQVTCTPSIMNFTRSIFTDLLFMLLFNVCHTHNNHNVLTLYTCTIENLSKLLTF